MIAHVAGVPVEEFLPLVPAMGAGAGLLLLRARMVTARIARRAGRRHRRSGTYVPVRDETE